MSPNVLLAIRQKTRNLDLLAAKINKVYFPLRMIYALSDLRHVKLDPFLALPSQMGY